MPAPSPHPAPRTSAAVALAATAALGAGPFAGRPAAAAIAAALLPLAVARHRRADALGRNAALLSSLGLGSALVPVGGFWSWPAPAIVMVAVALRPGWRGRDGLASWLRRGSLSAGDLGWIAAIVAASGIALLGWTALRRPDVSDLTRALPPLAAPVLLAGGTAWAALNAFGEEAIFRGALLAALESALGARAALLVQALAFGLVHYRGFPRGVDGVALAALYGLMLGALRRRTGGLLGPCLAHWVADVVILALLVAGR